MNLLNPYRFGAAAPPEDFVLKTNLQSGSTFDPGFWNNGTSSVTIDYGDGTQETTIGSQSGSHTYTDGEPSHNVTLVSTDLSTITLLLIDNDGITDVDFTDGYPNCDSLWISDNDIDTVPIEGLSACTFIDCNFSTVTQIDFGTVTTIDDLDLTASDFTSIDVSAQLDLEILEIGFCALTSIDISNITKLIDLDIRNNTISATNLADVIIDLDGFGESNGELQYSGVPDVSALSAYNSLITKSWTINGSAPA